MPILFVTATSSAEDVGKLKAKLAELKSICDEKLMTEEECEAARKPLVERLKASFKEAPNETWFCNYAGQSEMGTPMEVGSDSTSFAESASAGVAVKEILDTAGLVGNFVVRPANVPNAMASIRMGQRFIEYNPAFVEQLKLGTKTNWAVYSVLAHEIGHHLQGHTITAGGSRPDLELEADYYSGFILKKMGATLAEAQRAMTKFGSDTSTGTHPAKALRLAAIKKGWDAASKTPKTPVDGVPTVQDPLPEELPTPMPAPGPGPQPAQPQFAFRCVVNGEQVLIDHANRILSVPRNGAQVGQRVPSSHPNCAFNLAAPPAAVYCVAHNGYVFFGTPMPVGQCIQCSANMC